MTRVLQLLATVLAISFSSLANAQIEVSKHIEFSGQNASKGRILLLNDSSMLLATETLAHGTRDIILSKLTATGDTVWNKRIDAGANDYLGDVVEQNGDVFVISTGVSQSFSVSITKLDGNGDSLNFWNVAIPVPIDFKDAKMYQNQIIAGGEVILQNGKSTPGIVIFDVGSGSLMNAAVVANGGNGRFNSVLKGATGEIYAAGQIDNDSAFICKFDPNLLPTNGFILPQIEGSFNDISAKGSGFLAVASGDSITGGATHAYIMEFDSSVSILSMEQHQAYGDLEATHISNWSNNGYAIGGWLDSGQFRAPFIRYVFNSGDTVSKMLNYVSQSGNTSVLDMSYNNGLVATLSNTSITPSLSEGLSVYLKDSLPSQQCNPGIMHYWKSTLTVNTVLANVTLQQQNVFTAPVGASVNVSNVTPSVDTSFCFIPSQPIVFNPLPDTVTLCGSSATLDASHTGIVSYVWSDSIQQPIRSVSNNGMITVYGFDAQGTKYADSTYVNLKATPSLVIGSSSGTVCPGDSVTLSANIDPHILGWWKNAPGIVDTSKQVTKAEVQQSIWFHYTALDTSNGCISRDSLQVVIQGTASAPYTLNGIAQKKNGKAMKYSQVYLITYKNGVENVLASNKTDVNGNFTFTHNEPEVYIKIEPNARLYNGQRITYYKKATVIDSARSIRYDGCSSSKQVTIKTLKGTNRTGVQSAVAQNDVVQLIPNPNNGQFNIVLNTESSGTVEIYATSGSVIHSSHFNKTNQVFVDAQIPAGFYIVSVKLEDGTVSLKRCVIEN